MTTTALIIEHLISGVQCLVWLILLVITLLGFDWIKLDQIKGTETFILPVLLAIAYPLGIFIDNLADDIFKRGERKITSNVLKVEGLGGKKLTMMQVMGEANSEFAREYLGYVRSRVRLSRSTVLNFILITGIAVVFTLIRLSVLLGQSIRFIVICEVLCGLIIILFGFHSWYRSSQTFSKQIVRAHKARRNPGSEAKELVIAPN